jgi:hypothetical protein
MLSLSELSGGFETWAWLALPQKCFFSSSSKIRVKENQAREVGRERSQEMIGLPPAARAWSLFLPAFLGLTPQALC